MRGAMVTRVLPAAALAASKLPPLTLALLFCLTAVALRWGALALSPLGLQGDEAQYWSWSRDLAFGYFSKPPMIGWLIRATTTLCGEGAGCIRGASALVHGGTGLLLFFLARRLYDPTTGLWACGLYLTLPGISFSSGIISTDVPLLFFWAAALLALERVMATRAPLWGLALGVALGLGLLSKYAMVFFVGCLLIYAVFTPERRWLLRSSALYIALAVGLLLLAPNIWWNLENGWLTLSHTAQNANLEGPLLRPDKGLEFLLSQAGVFGPILLACLLVAAWSVLRGRAGEPARFLVFFSLPILALITLEAFLSRAHANWAATAYVAGSVLVAASLRAPRWRVWRGIAVGLHGAAALALLLLFAAPGLVGPQRALARLAGWDVLAGELRARMAEQETAVLLGDQRMEVASLLYQFRDAPVALHAWDRNGRIDNHFELTRPYRPPLGTMLLLTRHPNAKQREAAFCASEALGEILRPDGYGGGTTYHLFLVRDRCS